MFVIQNIRSYVNYEMENSHIDYVYAVDHFVKAGETETSSGMSVNPGGKGLNQSIALARAGVEVCHAGMVGEEGRILIDRCIENGVNVDRVRMIQGRSGHTIIQVDQSGENSILLFGGANRCMTASFIDEVLADFGRGDMILLQNEINLLDVIIDKAYDKGLRIVLNPSPYDDALLTCDLSKVSYFLLNEIEGAQMTERSQTDAQATEITVKPGPKEILREIRRKYPDAKTVLTLGAEGAYYDDSEDVYYQSAFPVKAVDTTAAGDTFTGYFIASVMNGLSPEDSLRLASKAASIAVTRPGALDSIPWRKEVLESLGEVML